MEHAVIRLKAGEKTPFYEQIYAYFAAAIRSGALAAGEKLPSKRRLAQDCLLYTSPSPRDCS